MRSWQVFQASEVLREIEEATPEPTGSEAPQGEEAIHVATMAPQAEPLALHGIPCSTANRTKSHTIRK